MGGGEYVVVCLAGREWGRGRRMLNLVGALSGSIDSAYYLGGRDADRIPRVEIEGAGG